MPSDTEETTDGGRLIWFLVDRSEPRGGVGAVAKQLEERGTETQIVTITDVIGSAAREAVAGGAERILRGLRVAWQGRGGEENFLQAIRREQPDLLVVTAARYARPLSLLQSLTGTSVAQIGLPLDFNLGSRWFDGALDAFVVSGERANRRTADAGYDEDRIYRAGPPVAPNFADAVDRQVVREELGFGDDPAVLVRAESFDATTLDRLVFQATLVDRDFDIIFHHNGDAAVSRQLRQSAEQHGLSAAMFGRVPDLERYVTASDLVVASPAEPLTSEIVATRRPMLLVGEATDVSAQVETLTDGYGAAHLEDVLRLGSRLDDLLDADALEALAEAASETELNPDNDAVADALVEALEASPSWALDRPGPGTPPADDAGSEGDEGVEPAREGPFEQIGTGGAGADGGRSDRPKLEGPDREPSRASISRAEAKDQLAELILDERELERRLSELEREQERWRNRLDLAREWGEDDLADEAEDVLREYIDDASQVRDDLEDIRRQKQKLKRAAKGGTVEVPDPDEPSRRSSGPSNRAEELEERFEEMEIDRDLEDLRDRIEGELGED